MSFQRRRWALIGGIFLASVILAGCVLLRHFDVGGPFAAAAAALEAGEMPKDLPPFVVRNNGRAGKIQPVYLPWEDSRGGNGLIGLVDGCLPAGPAVDVLWSRGGLYLSKRKGQLRRVWGGDAVQGRFGAGYWGKAGVCFDGKYVWAALRRFDKSAPRLIVIEPQSEQTWEFGAEHGLPLAGLRPDAGAQDRAHFSVGPISPGKICIVAWAGTTQLATVSFDPETGVSSNVFHRAEVPLEATPGQEIEPKLFAKTDLIFKAGQILCLAPPGAKGGESSMRLLIERRVDNARGAPPLLLDPETLSLEVMTAPDGLQAALRTGFYVVHDGALYWLRQVPGLKRKLVLSRIAPPRFEEEQLLSDMAVGRLTAYGDRIAILGRICWLWKPGSPDIERVNVQAPWSSRGYLNVGGSSIEQVFEGKRYYVDEVYPSQHYGVLAAVSMKQGPRSFVSADLTFQFGLASDPRLTPDSHAAPAVASAELASALPAGASASELRLYSAMSDGRALAALDGSVESNNAGELAYPALAREIVRQALLTAAHDELQWTTRDAILRETSPPADEAAAKFRLYTQFSSRDARFWIDRLEQRGNPATVWREKLTMRAAPAIRSIMENWSKRRSAGRESSIPHCCNKKNCRARRMPPQTMPRFRRRPKIG